MSVDFGDDGSLDARDRGEHKINGRQLKKRVKNGQQQHHFNAALHFKVAACLPAIILEAPPKLNHLSRAL